MIAPLLRWYTSRDGFWHSERKEIGRTDSVLQTNDRYFDLFSRKRKVSAIIVAAAARFGWCGDSLAGAHDFIRTSYHPAG